MDVLTRHGGVWYLKLMTNQGPDVCRLEVCPVCGREAAGLPADARADDCLYFGQEKFELNTPEGSDTPFADEYLKNKPE